MIAGMYGGPIVGGMVGGVSDFLGMLIAGQGSLSSRYHANRGLARCVARPHRYFTSRKSQPAVLFAVLSFRTGDLFVVASVILVKSAIRHPVSRTTYPTTCHLATCGDSLFFAFAVVGTFTEPCCSNQPVVRPRSGSGV